MSQKSNPLYQIVQSELITKAVGSIQEQAEQDLQRPDPKDDKAIAEILENNDQNT